MLKELEVALVLLMLIPIGLASSGNITPDEILGGNGTAINASNASYLTPSPMDITPDKIMAGTATSSNSTEAEYWINRLASLLKDMRVNDTRNAKLSQLYNHAVAKNITDEDVYILSAFTSLLWDIYQDLEVMDSTGTSTERKNYNEILEWIVYNETNQGILDNLKDQKKIYPEVLILNGFIFTVLGDYKKAANSFSMAIEQGAEPTPWYWSPITKAESLEELSRMPSKHST